MATKRPPRRDAVTNRARVLDAAEAVFAEQGTDASTEVVAERAGVGVGTVFRHFPTKEVLVGAVLERVLGRSAEMTRAHLDDPDPGAAFFQVLRRIVDQAGLKKALMAGLSTPYAEAAQRDWVGPLRDALAELLPRAQRAGAVRPDVEVAEVIAVIVAAARAAQHTEGDPVLQGRSVGVILDGLLPR